MRPTRRQLLALLASVPAAVALPRLSRAASPKDVATWAGAIDAFEASDKNAPPPSKAVLFTGSSSVRKWATLSADMAPLPVINRGFGGAHLPHVTHYAQRIVLPYAPRAIVLYAGDNDIAWGASAEQVRDDLVAFLDAVNPALPDVPVWFLSIKPSPLRWDSWPEMARANTLITELASTRAGLHFVDVASPLLDGEGQPVPSRFAKDGLHLSADGYRAWTAVVRPALAQLMPVPTAD